MTPTLNFTMKVPLLLLMACAAFGFCHVLASDPLVLSRQEVPKGDHKVIFERVVPPTVAVPVSASAETVTSDSASEAAALPRRMLSLSCTVYGREFTEVRWQDAAGGAYVIWSSLDLTYFMGRSTGGFVHGGVRYEIFAGLGEGLAEDTPAALEAFRALARPTTPGSWYAVVNQPAAVPEGAFDGMNALHLYFEANKEAIIAEHEQMKAANAARLAREAAQPKVKKDTVIRFWTIPNAPASTQPESKEGQP